MTIRKTTSCEPHKVSKFSLRYWNKCSLLERSERGVVGCRRDFVFHSRCCCYISTVSLICQPYPPPYQQEFLHETIFTDYSYYTGQFLEVKYMKFTYFEMWVIHLWEWETITVIRILRSCEKKARKKFRLERDSNQWPLRYSAVLYQLSYPQANWELVTSSPLTAP